MAPRQVMHQALLHAVLSLLTPARRCYQHDAWGVPSTCCVQLHARATHKMKWCFSASNNLLALLLSIAYKLPHTNPVP